MNQQVLDVYQKCPDGDFLQSGFEVYVKPAPDPFRHLENTIMKLSNGEMIPISMLNELKHVAPWEIMW